MKPISYFHAPLEGISIQLPSFNSLLDYDILKDAKRKEELVKIMIQTLEDFGYR